MPEEQNYITPLLSEFNIRLRDVEEKQRLLKERLLLIGENLVDTKEEIETDVSKIKNDVGKIKQDLAKIKITLERVIDEIGKRARKSETNILRKQFEMFQPLKFATIEDVEKMIREKG